MATLEDLPAEQNAVIQLLLKQGKSYEYIAGMLRIEPEDVRDRAHAAVDALGPESGRRLPEQRRAEIADYLLGQQSADEEAATREHLAGSAGARAWARAIAGELRTVGGDSVPSVPDDDGARSGARRSSRAATRAAGAATRTRGRAGAATKAAPPDDANGSDATAATRPAKGAAKGSGGPDEPEEPEAPGDEDGEPAARRGGGPALPSSRLGGALLIGGVAVVLLVVLIIVLSGGGDDKSDKGGSSNTTSTAAQQQARPVAQINLKGSGKALGIAQVRQSGSGLGLALVAQNLPPTTKSRVYALWLYSSSSSARRLGYTPAVGKDGRLTVIVPALPPDTRTYRELVVTREPITQQGQQQPTRPGPIILRGPLKLG